MTFHHFNFGSVPNFGYGLEILGFMAFVANLMKNCYFLHHFLIRVWNTDSLTISSKVISTPIEINIFLKINEKYSLESAFVI